MSKFKDLLEDSEPKTSYILTVFKELIDSQNIMQLNEQNERQEWRKICESAASKLTLDEFAQNLVDSRYEINSANKAAKIALNALSNVHGSEFEKMEI